MSKYTVLPTHFTHVIELSTSKESKVSKLLFKPIVGIVIDDFNIHDDCKSFYITNDGRKYAGDDVLIMLFDCINNEVNHGFKLFDFSPDHCLCELILEHRREASMLGGVQ